MLPRLSEIYIYPVKGLRRVQIDRALVEHRGLQHDRRWMVVDENGRFRSQRELAQMATVRASVDGTGLVLSKGSSSIRLPLEPDGPRMMVQIWNNEVLAMTYGGDATEWLSDVLGAPCRLVKMSRDTIRPASADYSRPGDHVSFADGFPLLLTTETSLENLNQRLDPRVPIHRFRPNLVVSGCDPWAEDDWATLRIGEVPFRNVKPCGRCLVTTVDQETGIPQGEEPLRTLVEFRLVGNSANFGVNLIPDAEGWIEVGQELCLDPLMG